MFENINVRSDVAVYQQIENEVQFAITSGRLKPGDKLPPVREVSEQIQVNLNTVAKAYRDLEVLGYIFTRRGRGVFVQDGIREKCQTDCRTKIFSRFHQVICEAKAAGVTQAELQKCLGISHGLDIGPYEPTPSEITKLAKRRSPKKKK